MNGPHTNSEADPVQYAMIREEGSVGKSQVFDPLQVITPDTFYAEFQHPLKIETLLACREILPKVTP